jgi:hypothetical protein
MISWAMSVACTAMFMSPWRLMKMATSLWILIYIQKTRWFFGSQIIQETCPHEPLSECLVSSPFGEQSYGTVHLKHMEPRLSATNTFSMWKWIREPSFRMGTTATDKFFMLSIHLRRFKLHR